MSRGMIIGIAGPSASGKTTVAMYLAEKYGAHRAKYSDILIEIAKASRPQIALEKNSLQELSTRLRTTYGEDYLTQKLKEKLEFVQNSVVVIEGNRRNVDIDFLLSLAEEQGKDLLLLYIDADRATRLSRMNARLKKEGRALVSEKEFNVLENDECEEELPLVRARILKYGIVIDNTNLSPSELETKVTEFIDVEVAA